LGQRTSNLSRRRVVVTGLGALSPVGGSLEDNWRGLTRGTSAIRRVRRFSTEELDVHTGGEVDLEPHRDAIPPTTLRRPDRSIEMALLAAGWALEEANLLEAARRGTRIGVLLGSGFGPCDALSSAYASYAERGPRGIRPTTVPRCMYNGMAAEVSIAFHLTGRQNVVSAACASASCAMAHAYDAVAFGGEDVVLTGGADSPLTASIYASWVKLRVLSQEKDPAKAMRPFDKNRDGFVLSEGAGMLVFETLEHARDRGARIYGEILGHGASSDASHITKPDQTGQATALRDVLHQCGLAPEEIDYINAHGTSTQLNDATETAAIKEVFGPHAAKLPVSSTKSVLGHTMGASAALELIAVMQAFARQTLPPTVNLDTPDPECDLDYVPNAPRRATVRTALSNSFAFGGSNSVIAARLYED
jgi:beta-ketoacyl-acyl-carrier-protein synthase II